MDGEDKKADVYFPEFNKNEYQVTELGKNSDIVDTKEGQYVLNYTHNLYQKIK